MQTEEMNFLRFKANKEAELSVCIIAENSRIDFETMSKYFQSQHLFNPQYRNFYKICEQVYTDKTQENATAQIWTLCSNDESLRNVFWEIKEGFASGGSCIHYAQVIREYAVRREIYQLAYELHFKYNEFTAPTEMIEYVKSEMKKIEDEYLPIVAPKNAITEILIEHQTRTLETYQQKRERLIPTGINSFDELLDGGFEEGDFMIIGARPSMGKTAMGISMLVKNMEQKRASSFISLEMPNFQIIRRAISQMQNIPITHMKGGTLSEDEGNRVIMCGVLISTLSDDLQLFLEDGTATLSQMKEHIKKHAKAGCKMVFIDYIQLIKPDEMIKNQNREQQIAQISRSLKSYAKEFGLVIVAMAQLNKEAEGKKPTMSSIRESEALIQDADYVLLLDRPEKRGDKECEINGIMVDCIGKGFGYLEKARNGRTGVLSMEYTAELAKFSDIIPTFEMVNYATGEMYGSQF